MPPSTLLIIFFFNDTATTEIYTLSLHDALPILAIHFQESPATKRMVVANSRMSKEVPRSGCARISPAQTDRKSTRLNSSHSQTSNAVFCLKKKTHMYKKGITHVILNIHH